MFYEGINANVFRRSIAFAIALVVTSRSSSFEYTISVHAVHAGAERNECNIEETIQTFLIQPLLYNCFLFWDYFYWTGIFCLANLFVSVYILSWMHFLASQGEYVLYVDW